MSKHTVAEGKAFAINQDRSIYGTFAEIGAGQETVNHFFKAGLASQTVAKSMSAYDMTFSDEIYGKQNRYVCKDRLITMLDHEFRLLQRRLKKSRGREARFFTFANTAVTGDPKRGTTHPHGWMGIRFQTAPLGPSNDITFHIDCRDDNRLRQYEALGVVGVNLIYACFYFRKDYKKFISSLTDHLHKPRIEINGLTSSGPDMKPFNQALINKELLRQQLSQALFFNSKGQSELLTDAVYEKPLLIFPVRDGEKRELERERQIALNRQRFKAPPLPIVFLQNSVTDDTLPKHIRKFCKNDFCLLISPSADPGNLKQLLRQRCCHGEKITFIVSKDYFKNRLFYPSPREGRNVLEKAGGLFDKNTLVQVSSKEKIIRTHQFPEKELNLLRDYLVTAKYIEDLLL